MIARAAEWLVGEVGAFLARVGIGGARRRAIGSMGEDVAASFLSRLGYSILDRNVRVPMGEADIVARAPDGTIVLVEVKSRVIDPVRQRPSAESQVGSAKQRKLLAILAHLVRANRWEKSRKRIDIVAVEFTLARKEAGGAPIISEPPRVRHLINAVKPGGRS